MKSKNPVYREYTRDHHSHICKLQWSIKSKREVKRREPKDGSQWNKEFRKNNFRSGMVLSRSSKLLALHSYYKHHIKQWGTASQILLYRWHSNQPCQEDNISKTLSGITHWTPNKLKTIFHNFEVIGQGSKRWSTDPSGLLHS